MKIDERLIKAYDRNMRKRAKENAESAKTSKLNQKIREKYIR